MNAITFAIAVFGFVGAMIFVFTFEYIKEFWDKNIPTNWKKRQKIYEYNREFDRQSKINEQTTLQLVEDIFDENNYSKELLFGNNKCSKETAKQNFIDCMTSGRYRNHYFYKSQKYKEKYHRAARNALIAPIDIESNYKKRKSS